MSPARRLLASTLIVFALGSGLHAQEAVPAATDPQAAALDAADALEPSLVALGTLGAANVYYSYLAIGSAADSFVSGSYDAALATAIANEVRFLNEGSITNLKAMLASDGLSPEDKEAVDYLIVTFDILNRQAKALVTFITDRNDQGMDYQEYRTMAWSRIRQLFGK